jgi:hypothetical protein
LSSELVVLSPLESALDEGIGEAVAEPALPDVPSTLDPLTALEEAVLPALTRPPCLVMFSGGRDSSVVLAVAARVARREGLPLPVPSTDAFPGFADTHEAEWQRLVLDHLRLTELIVHTSDGQLNLLGPMVQGSIRRHGLIAPAGCHLFLPTLRDAAGGSVLTGNGGDALFNGGSFARLRAVAARAQRADARTPLILARALAPKRLRRAVARRRLPELPSWLTPAARELMRDLLADEGASEPPRWDAYVRWWSRHRYAVAARQAAQILAKAHDVQVEDPLMAPRFLAALARRGGARGWGTRTAAFLTLFSGLLPERLLTRTSKAVFTRAYWSHDARHFINTWDGTGLPLDLVDVDGLRSVWAREAPDARTGLLLQAAWASTLPADELKDPVNCRLE